MFKIIEWGIYFLCNFFLLCIILQFIKDFLGKANNIKYEIGGIIFFYMVTFAVKLYIGIPILNFAANVLGIFVITLAYNGTFRKKILLSILIPMINASCDMITYYIVIGQLNNDYSGNFSFIFTVLLVWICQRLVTSLQTKKEEVYISRKYIYLLLLIPVCGLVIMYCITIANMKSYGVIMGICVLVINMLTFYLYNAVIENEWNRLQNELLEKSIESYENELRIMGKSQRKIQSVKHDMRHHLIELKAFAQKDSSEELMDYLSDIENDLELEQEIVYSGSYEVDSLLNYLLSNAKKELKNVNVKVCIPQEIHLSRYRFNIIVGNLLENAIEAARDSEEQYLDVILRVERGILKIDIVNSYTGKLEMKKGRWITKKIKKSSMV